MLIAPISSVNSQKQPSFQSKKFFNQSVDSVAKDMRDTLKTVLNKEIVVGEPLQRVSEMAEAWKKEIDPNYKLPKKSFFKKVSKFFRQLSNNEGWIRLK